MTDDVKALIAEAEAELLEWVVGNKSHWNSLHGSVTGDYAGQFEATARADEAEIRRQIARVEALMMLSRKKGSEA